VKGFYDRKVNFGDNSKLRFLTKSSIDSGKTGIGADFSQRPLMALRYNIHFSVKLCFIKYCFNKFKYLI
jgi:hypothetical protein